MYILGISCFYHDSAACLLKDGLIVAAAEEERFSRKKHDFSFPAKTVNFCLERASITSSDIDHVVFYEKPLIKFERLLYTFLSTYPHSYNVFLKSMPIWLKEKLHIGDIIKKELKYKGRILFVTHHQSHASSAFLASEYKDAAILTTDAAGEWSTTSLGKGEDTQVDILKEVHFPHSLGLFYSAITAFLGFKVNNDEYKVMGLAPYGTPSYYERLADIVKVKDDGSYKLDMRYFDYHKKMRMYSSKLVKAFGKPRKPESELSQRDKDLAASAQKLLEDILLKMVNHLYEITGKKKLCIAGGVALNCVANGRLLRESPFEDIFVQPAAGDAGGALGAAYYVYNTLLKKPRAAAMNSVYLGPDFSNQEVQSFLDESHIKYEKLDWPQLNKIVAKKLSDTEIVGWFQGRMEIGPRALGNRSILANPSLPEMKDILNRKIKFRESFRPFAPVVLYEFMNEYFETDRESPFMLFTVKVKEDCRAKIPAVTHLDGSARVQTLKESQNQHLYQLLHEFYRITNLPVLINTSFNVRGEPIVCTPQDAYKCFLKSGLDALVINNYLIVKEKGIS